MYSLRGQNNVWPTPLKHLKFCSLQPLRNQSEMEKEITNARNRKSAWRSGGVQTCQLTQLLLKEKRNEE